MPTRHGLFGTRGRLDYAARHAAACIACGPTIGCSAIAQVILALVNYKSAANNVLRGIKQSDDVIHNVNRSAGLSLRSENVAQVTHMSHGIIGTSMSAVQWVEMTTSCHTAI